MREASRSSVSCAAVSVGWAEGFGADGPDGGDPGEVGAGAPLVGEVEPVAGADGCFDLLAGLKGEEGGVADEDGGVGLLQHGEGSAAAGRKVGWVLRNLRKRISA